MDDLLTTDDAARELGIGPQRVRQLVKLDRLVPVRRVRGAYLFAREDIERFNALPRVPGRPASKAPADTEQTQPSPRTRGRPR